VPTNISLNLSSSSPSASRHESCFIPLRCGHLHPSALTESYILVVSMHTMYNHDPSNASASVVFRYTPHNVINPIHPVYKERMKIDEGIHITSLNNYESVLSISCSSLATPTTERNNNNDQSRYSMLPPPMASDSYMSAIALYDTPVSES
jgi:hypothetical protein